MALPLPEITPETEPFWTGGAVGELRIAACGACDHRIHPPQLICPSCLSRDVAPCVASGEGFIHSFTINHQQWVADLAVPYALIVVDLADQPGVRLTARLETADLSRIEIGAAVKVDFEERSGVYIPFFRLA
jgi:uncharacterized protein